jgi:hypothetical protein
MVYVASDIKNLSILSARLPKVISPLNNPSNTWA